MSIKKNRQLMIEQIKRLRGELNESVNEAVSSSKIKASLDKQTDFKLDADDEIKLYPKPIRIEPDKFDSQLKKYSKAFKNTLIYLYGTTANEYGTDAFLAVVSRLKSTTKIIIMSDKYAKVYGKGSLKDSDIKGVLKMNSLIASNAELNESVNKQELKMSIKKNRELMVDQITRLRGELNESNEREKRNEPVFDSPSVDANAKKVYYTFRSSKKRKVKNSKVTKLLDKTSKNEQPMIKYKDGGMWWVNDTVFEKSNGSYEVERDWSDSDIMGDLGTSFESVNEARMKEDDFMDRLEDYASDVIPSKDYIKKSKRDLLKQLIGNMRTDKKAKALYTYWSKNKGKELLDRVGSLFESVNEAKIAFLNDKLINSRIQKSGLLPLLGGNNKSLSKDKVKFTQELNSFLKKLYKKYSTLPIK